MAWGKKAEVSEKSSPIETELMQSLNAIIQHSSYFNEHALPSYGPAVVEAYLKNISLGITSPQDWFTAWADPETRAMITTGLTADQQAVFTYCEVVEEHKKRVLEARNWAYDAACRSHDGMASRSASHKALKNILLSKQKTIVGMGMNTVISSFEAVVSTRSDAIYELQEVAEAAIGRGERPPHAEQALMVGLAALMAGDSKIQKYLEGAKQSLEGMYQGLEATMEIYSKFNVYTEKELKEMNNCASGAKNALAGDDENNDDDDPPPRYTTGCKPGSSR